MRTIFGRGKPLRIAIYVACLSAFVFFGYDQGVLSGLLENEYFQEQFGSPVWSQETQSSVFVWFWLTYKSSHHLSLVLLLQATVS